MAPIGPHQFGAIADGASHPASNYYASQSALEADCPGAVLSDEMDWVGWCRAINAAILPGDPAMTVRKAVKRIKAEAGLYILNRTVPFWSIQGLIVEGEGDPTRLHFTQPLDQGLDLNGVAYSTFADMLVTGAAGALVRSPVCLRWVGTGRSTAYVDLVRVRVHSMEFVYGIDLGGSGNGGQVDTISLDKCLVRGQWTPAETTRWHSGYRIGDGVAGNNFAHALDKCSGDRNRYGVFNNASQLRVSGGTWMHHDVDFLHQGKPGYFSVRDIRCEGSRRLYECTGGTTALAMAELENINWVGNMLNPVDGYWIKHGRAGVLTLKNVMLTNPGVLNPGVTPRAYLGSVDPQWQNNTPQLVVNWLGVITTDTFANSVHISGNSVMVRGMHLRKTAAHQGAGAEVVALG